MPAAELPEFRDWGIAAVRLLQGVVYADEAPEGYDRLPKLFRKSRLGYDETLLCVLLREPLRQFEEEELSNERRVVETGALFDRWRVLAQAQTDEVKARRELSSALGKLEELGFVRKVSDEPETWEVR